MPRDHARVNLAIWQDPDWRALPPLAQHLYLVLWTHPELSYAGVVDWRPGRLAALAGEWTRADVERAADCLEARLFIVRDDDTEECLIRSWFKWDGLLKQPIMAVSFANAYAAVASNVLRGVIVHEARRYREKEPNLAGWSKPQVRQLLDNPAVDPRSRTLPTVPPTPNLTPPVTPDLTLRGGIGVNPSSNTPPTPTPAPTTVTPAPRASGRKRPTRPLPDDWQPTDKHREQAAAKGVDVDRVAFRFRNWARANDARYVDWDATFRNWIDKERVPAPTPAAPNLAVGVDQWLA